MVQLDLESVEIDHQKEDKKDDQELSIRLQLIDQKMDLLLKILREQKR